MFRAWQKDVNSIQKSVAELASVETWLEATRAPASQTLKQYLKKNQKRYNEIAHKQYGVSWNADDSLWFRSLDRFWTDRKMKGSVTKKIRDSMLALYHNNILDIVEVEEATLKFSELIESKVACPDDGELARATDAYMHSIFAETLDGERQFERALNTALENAQ